MNRSHTTHNLTFLLISALLTVSVVAGLEIYHAYSQVPKPNDIEHLLTPISPVLKTSVLTTLEQREL